MDVTILVYAHREETPDHPASRAWGEDTINSESAYGVSELVLSGFMHVVTHPKVCERPTPLAVAMDVVHQIRSQPHAGPIRPGPRHWAIVEKLLRTSDATGNLVPDASHAALAIESGCDWITTDKGFCDSPDGAPAIHSEKSWKPMPRKARFSLPHLPAHVMQRGQNRAPVFFEAQDSLEYLKILKRVADTCHCAIHASVLMTNHIHLLLTPDAGDAISRLFQACGRQYVGSINHTYRRRGTLWEGRHKGTIVESTAYVLTCMRSIEQHPVRAGLVARPADYRWSSYAANALGEDNWVISPHDAYVHLGQTLPQRREAYRALYAIEFTAEALARIRTCTQSGTPMGSVQFKAQREQTLRRKVGGEKRGRLRRTRMFDLA